MDWILKNKSTYPVTIYLDNDGTYGILDGDTNHEFILKFNDYLGWSDGVRDLLTAIGIKNERYNEN